MVRVGELYEVEREDLELRSCGGRHIVGGLAVPCVGQFDEPAERIRETHLFRCPRPDPEQVRRGDDDGHAAST